jgi:hypothetical protein
MSTDVRLNSQSLEKVMTYFVNHNTHHSVLTCSLVTPFSSGRPKFQQIIGYSIPWSLQKPKLLSDKDNQKYVKVTFSVCATVIVDVSPQSGFASLG